MLAPKRALRVAPRGSGPGAKRRRPCPPLRAAAPWTGRDEGRPDQSTRGLRPGSNNGLDKEASWPGRKAAQSGADGSGSACCGLPSAGPPNRSRQPAWMTASAWLAIGFQEPGRCHSGTAASARPEAMAARTRPPTALLRERDRLCRASIRPRRSLKSSLTPAPFLPVPMSVAALTVESQELSGARPLRWPANAPGAPYSGFRVWAVGGGLNAAWDGGPCPVQAMASGPSRRSKPSSAGRRCRVVPGVRQQACPVADLAASGQVAGVVCGASECRA